MIFFDAPPGSAEEESPGTEQDDQGRLSASVLLRSLAVHGAAFTVLITLTMAGMVLLFLILLFWPTLLMWALALGTRLAGSG